MEAVVRALDGQVVLVTGASRGLGRVIALALADAGASLHLVADGTEEELTQVAAACVGRCPSARVTRATLDLSRPEAPAAMVDAAIGEHGRIDVLVNNAGMRIRKPFGEFSADDFDRLMAVNLRAPMLAASTSTAMKWRALARLPLQTSSTVERNRTAWCTSCAAARACRPRVFVTITSRRCMVVPFGIASNPSRLPFRDRVPETASMRRNRCARS
jgi:NAD(P)-dependent dehydrogenase (short-subunit alcohol dehydrogenase family)